jgi:hypothetical protein
MLAFLRVIYLDFERVDSLDLCRQAVLAKVHALATRELRAAEQTAAQCQLSQLDALIETRKTSYGVHDSCLQWMLL